MVAVAAPAVVVAALFALLFMLVWYLWGQTIVKTLTVNLPVVGNVIGKLVAQGLDATYVALVSLFDGYVMPIVEMIVRPIAAVENTIAQLYGVGVDTYNTLYNVIHVTIPYWAVGAYTRAAGEYTALFNQAEAGIQATQAGAFQQIQSLAGTVSGDISRVESDIAATQAGAFTLIESVAAGAATAIAATETRLLTDIGNGVAAAEAYTLTAYRAATSYAENLATTEAANLAQAISDTEAFAATTATAAIGALVTDIDHAITTAIGVAWPDIATVIPELEGVIGTGDADILDALKRIDWTIPATLAGVAALLGVTTLTLARYLRDCGIPNCQNLSQLGQDLQALLGLVEDASFLALLVELVEHPGNASHVVQSTFGAGISEAVAGFRSLVSI